jgi:3'-phosphoadenosine 5'-phosphosulfate sulfotransferase (PAPS reductase)/FAD synthetase
VKDYFDFELSPEPTTYQDCQSDHDPLEPDAHSYDLVLIAFSGGKDSLACLLHVLDLGVPREKIELHHHLVDGREGSTLMDWPCTEAYCEAIAKAFGIKLTFSHRVGGFEREMLRNGDPTAPVAIPLEDGYKVVGGLGPTGVRRKFPQVSADLSVRWCSSSLKVDCFARYLTNNPKFLTGKTLVITGERAEESKARANYKRFEPHRCDNRNGKKVQRYVDVWRTVHAWTEQQVWDTIERWKVTAHPAYYLGFGRCSCRACIFGSKDQWATVRDIAPEQFKTIANYEREFKVTIHRKNTVVQRADEGTPYDTDPFWVEIANQRTFDCPVFIESWVLPKGAFGDSCGPT